MARGAGEGARGNVLGWGTLLLAACAACASARPPAAEAAEGPGAADAPGDPPPGMLRGSLSTRYRGRFAGASDHDLLEVLALDVGRPGEDAWTAHLLAHATLDLDDGDDPRFFSLQDTYERDLTGRLHRAHVDWRGEGPLERASLGRQLRYDTPEPAHFDGLSLETRAGPRSVRGGAYGGVPVHPFESSPEGDLVLGAFLEARPIQATRVRLDWMHLEDEYVLGEHDDDLVAVALGHALGERLLLEASHSRVEGRARDVRLRASWLEAEEGVALEAAYYRLLTTQRDLAVPLDPFTTSLFELEPFQRLGLGFSKDLGESLALAAGLEVRRLLEQEDAGTFNHEYERYHATLSATPPGDPALSLSLTADVWEGDDTVETWGADVSRAFGETLDVSLGSYYSLYAYDLFADVERDHVRAYYLRLRRTAGRLALDLRYELERDDFDTFHTVRIGTTWTF